MFEILGQGGEPYIGRLVILMKTKKEKGKMTRTTVLRRALNKKSTK